MDDDQRRKRTGVTSCTGGKPGRPKELPDELYADRGYYSVARRLLWMGIETHIAGRGTAHGSGLG